MRALVLSGGGGRGAYEFGVYKALHEHGYRPEVLSGTSVGAVTAAGIASGMSMEDIERMWGSLGTLKVIRPRYDVWRLPKWTHFLETTPLRDFLEDHLDFSAIRTSPMKLRVSAVDVNTGELRVFTNREIGVDHILASAAIPLLFPMVTIEGRTYWDGGLMANTPIGAAIEGGGTEITAVLLSPVGARPLGVPRNLWETTTRLVEIALLGNLKEDIKQAEAVNRLIARGLADPRWRQVHFHVISPTEHLGLLTFFNFNARRAKRFITWGYNDGLMFAKTSLTHPVEVQARAEQHADVMRRKGEA